MNERPRKARVDCFVDGFNLYHAIADLRDKAGRPMHHLKWLDLRSLATAFIKPQSEVVQNVRYFSAYATWLPDAYLRHRMYTAALQATGVKLVMGKFKEKPRRCRACGARWMAHEEKETDVNFAISLVNEAFKGSFDRALLITADSDLCPAIRLVTEHFPDRRLQILTPPGGYDLARELRGIAPTVRIRQKHLLGNLLPGECELTDGSVIRRPQKYARTTSQVTPAAPFHPYKVSKPPE